MAEVGRADMSGKKASKIPNSDKNLHPVFITGTWLNLIIQPVQIQPVAAQPFEMPAIGLPIMREGFVTETGFLRGHLF